MITNSHIEARPNRAGNPRAYLVGTRVRVQDIYVDSEVHGMTPDEIAAGYPHLTLAQVHAALAHYFDHREEIQGEVREDLSVNLRRRNQDVAPVGADVDAWGELLGLAPIASPFRRAKYVVPSAPRRDRERAGREFREAIGIIGQPGVVRCLAENQDFFQRGNISTGQR